VPPTAIASGYRHAGESVLFDDAARRAFTGGDHQPGGGGQERWREGFPFVTEAAAILVDPAAHIGKTDDRTGVADGRGTASID